MKKNRINIILITVVAAIWVMVILKATGSWSKEQEETVTESTVTPSVQKQKVMGDEKLNLNYPDPFLGKIDKPVIKNQGNTERKKQNDQLKIKEPISSNWPKVNYFGTVKNTNKSKTVAILSVNNREKRMLPGEVYEEIKLEKISGDSVLVSWGKDKRYISKN